MLFFLLFIQKRELETNSCCRRCKTRRPPKSLESPWSCWRRHCECNIQSCTFNPQSMMTAGRGDPMKPPPPSLPVDACNLFWIHKHQDNLSCNKIWQTRPTQHLWVLLFLLCSAHKTQLQEAKRELSGSVFLSWGRNEHVKNKYI